MLFPIRVKIREIYKKTFQEKHFTEKVKHTTKSVKKRKNSKTSSEAKEGTQGAKLTKYQAPFGGRKR